MGFIENKTFDEIKVGDFAELQHTLVEKDIKLFAIMSGDVNPAHVDIEFARGDMFHGIIAHGMWGASLISTILGTMLPGPGTIYLEQSLKFTHPILLNDTVTVRVSVLSRDIEKHRLELECICMTKEGKVAISGVAKVIAPTTKIKLPRIIMPDAILQNPNDLLYKQLVKWSKSMPPLITGIVHPVDELSLKGAVAAALDGIIVPILIGPKQKIIDTANSAKLDISGYELIDTKHSHEAADIAVQMAKDRKIEALMKGKLHTDELMAAVVNKTNGLRTGRRMSHIFALTVPNYSKPLFITDAALNLFPNLEDKVDIIQNAIDLFTTLGLGIPKVAILSAAETINEKIPSTLDAAALCKMADREQITGGVLDGPLALDNAISKESAMVKGITSKVAGDADILIAPDIESGNMLYKQMTYLSNIDAAGIVMGATVPIILTSRGSNEISRKMSSLMALIYTRKRIR